MPIYLVISHIVPRQGGPIEEKYVLEEAEASDIENLRERTHIPRDGKTYVCLKKHVTTFKETE